jgi:hypothetical protein
MALYLANRVRWFSVECRSVLYRERSHSTASTGPVEREPTGNKEVSSTLYLLYRFYLLGRL